MQGLQISMHVYLLVCTEKHTRNCRFQQALHGGVDQDTREQLDHILTVHFRGRYAAVDVTTLSPEHEDKAIGTNNFKATVHLHHHMAHLYEQYVTMC